MPSEQLSPQMLIWAYAQGYFPMAESRRGEVHWYSPDPRTIMPLETFHVSRSLRRRIRRGDYHITRDACFEQVIRKCAEPRSYARETWINPGVIEAFIQMHGLGLAHSVEAWVRPADERTGSDQADPAIPPPGGRLVGGVYGLALGGAFFGESMFSRATDASKVCLAHLVDHLRRQGFILLDVQFSNPHLEQFGIEEIPREAYLQRLGEALKLKVSWENE